MIGHQIGQGAYAVVKNGVNKKTGQRVAIKIYEKYKLLDQHRKKGVMREISLLRRCDNPHIIKLIDVIDTAKQVPC
jgi:serine/threonine protein kinase